MSLLAAAPKIDDWLPEAGGYYHPPGRDEAFDAAGSWDHAYVLLDNAPLRSKVRMTAEGYVRIRRSPIGSGSRARLRIEQLSQRQYFGTTQVKYEIEIDVDDVGSPRSWAIDSVSYDTKGQPVELTQLSQRGNLEETQQHLQTKYDATVAEQFSSNWSLLEAVQRLGGRPIDAIEFAMLEDLDLYKPNQRLTYRGTSEFVFGAHRVRLSGYQQIGDGILPYHYWLDRDGRLIFAYGGLKGLMFNPRAVAMATKPAKAGRSGS